MYYEISMYYLIVILAVCYLIGQINNNNTTILIIMFLESSIYGVLYEAEHNKQKGKGYHGSTLYYGWPSKIQNDSPNFAHYTR